MNERAWVGILGIVGAAIGCQGATESGSDTDCVDCGVQVGGAGDVVDCGVVVTEVPFSDDATVGHSGDEALALIGGPIDAAPIWLDERLEGLTITAAPLGATVTVRAPTNPDPHCRARIELDLIVTLTSDGGTFEESWEASGRFQEPWDQIALGGRIPVESLGGALDWAAIQPEAESLEIYLLQGGDDAGKIELWTGLLDPPATGPWDTAEMNGERTPVVHWGDLD